MKINNSVKDKIKETTRRTQQVSFDIDNENYIVEVATFFSMPIREKMIQEIKWMTEENSKKYGGEMLSIFLFIKLMTDIEWTDELDEDLDLFLTLAEFGVINKILDKIPENIIQEMSEFLMNIAEAQASLMEVERTSS